jgi:formamidopyrimidine-DNA glycosylase
LPGYIYCSRILKKEKAKKMPELPEVENIVQGLRKIILKKRLVKLESFRDDFFACRKKMVEVEKGIIREAKRRGKWIIIEMDDNNALLLHLGMSGQLIFAKGDCPIPKYALLEFVLEHGERLFYCDMRRFGKFDIIPIQQLCDCKPLKDLGVEPLTKDLDRILLSEMLNKSKRQIKDFLLDQKKIAGLGNIYACEILFDSKISPFKPANALTMNEVNRLCKSIQQVLKRAVEKGGSTIKNYVNATGEKGSYQLSHKVYGREGEKCFFCSTTIKREKQHGRSTYFCPECQKLR